MKIKDFTNVLDANYELGIIDNGEKVFQCKSNSSVLSHYADREIEEIALSPSLMGSSFIAITLKECES